MSLHISKPQDTELARIAYAAVEGVPTVEDNDRNRLGYHVWLFLRGELDTLQEAIFQARSRFKPRDLPREEVQRLIESALADLHEAQQIAEVPGSPEPTA